MSKITTSSLSGLFKELYADKMDALIPSSVSLLRMMDPNYDPVIEEMWKNSYPDLKETLGYKKDV